MKKVLYCIHGYIPSDEKAVYMNIYVLTYICGYYCWACPTTGTGIGFGLKSFDKLTTKSNDPVEVSLLIDNFISGNIVKIYTDDFKEVINAYNKIERELTEQLKTK